MSADSTDFKKIAELSRISIDETLYPAFEKDMRDIIVFTSIVCEATEGPEPFPSSLKNVFREDTIVPSPEREDLLCVAPFEKDGLFRVMRVVE